MKQILAVVFCAMFVGCGDRAARYAAPAGTGDGFRKLFPEEGIPTDWYVRSWADVEQPPDSPLANWKVEHGVLHGSEPRGTWLVSDRTYRDFILDFEFKLSERGNSGVGLRFPDAGDPAFDGLELQMVDARYHGDYQPPPDELTGSIYKAIAPKEQVHKPTEWNHYRITLQRAKLTVVLNGQTIQTVDLDQQTTPLERGSPLKDRPRKGHIGFQELSRGGAHVLIRNARIKELD